MKNPQSKTIGFFFSSAIRMTAPTLALLLLVSGLLFFTKLRAPLLEPQEPRYAEIPRQMLQSGSFAFTDIGRTNRRGPRFDRIVEFVNAYRADPSADPVRDVTRDRAGRHDARRPLVAQKVHRRAHGTCALRAPRV